MIKIVNFEQWVKIDSECVVSDSDWQKLRSYVLGRDKYTCVYCGTKEGPMEVDHVMPRSRGGLDTESNLVCACRNCNRSKKGKTPEEWGWKQSGSIPANTH